MNTKKIDAQTLILIIILMMGLINGLLSCSTSEAVYQQGNGEFKPMAKRSETTGWRYIEKK